METVEQIQARLAARFPGAEVALAAPPAAGLVLGAARAREIAAFLRDDPALRMDMCSNVTGIDWPEKPGRPGHLEVVYHLYSVALRHGPLVLRLRTANRTDSATLPSLTPVWRSCEFQEREVFDLFGVVFEGHPDLRRILMWDEFRGHPMRKDYVEPDDYEWEPTAHGAVAQKAQRHRETSTRNAGEGPAPAKAAP